VLWLARNEEGTIQPHSTSLPRLHQYPPPEQTSHFKVYIPVSVDYTSLRNTATVLQPDRKARRILVCCRCRILKARCPAFPQRLVVVLHLSLGRIAPASLHGINQPWFS